MKILLLMDPFIPVPPQHYGGVERVIYDIANSYVKLGHEVTIIAGPNSKSPGRLITYGNNGALSIAINVKMLWSVYSILRKEIKKHDVIHNFGRLIFIAPFLLTKTRKVQTYMRYVNKKNISFYDRIKPVNLIYSAVSDAIVGTGKTPLSNWRTVYNCAPVGNYTYRGNTSADSYLAFLGRIERCKGLHSAIKVAKLSGRKLIIAGNISDLEHERAYFHNEIEPEIDGKEIIYIGKVNDEQKNEFLGNAAALVTPVEWFEPFPIIIPEAYACGTPVLGFDNGGIREGIENGLTGFTSSTVDEMVEHVKMIGTLNRQACRLKAENEYSDTHVAQEYIKLYKG